MFNRWVIASESLVLWISERFGEKQFVLSLMIVLMVHWKNPVSEIALCVA